MTRTTAYNLSGYVLPKYNIEPSGTIEPDSGLEVSTVADPGPVRFLGERTSFRFAVRSAGTYQDPRLSYP